jgi:hypothetical protein
MGMPSVGEQPEKVRLEEQLLPCSKPVTARKVVVQLKSTPIVIHLLVGYIT